MYTYIRFTMVFIFQCKILYKFHVCVFYISFYNTKNTPFGKMFIFWEPRERRNRLDDFWIVGRFNHRTKGKTTEWSRRFRRTLIFGSSNWTTPQHDLQEDVDTARTRACMMGTRVPLGTLSSVEVKDKVGIGPGVLSWGPRRVLHFEIGGHGRDHEWILLNR